MITSRSQKKISESEWILLGPKKYYWNQNEHFIGSGSEYSHSQVPQIILKQEWTISGLKKHFWSGNEHFLASEKLPWAKMNNSGAREKFLKQYWKLPGLKKKSLGQNEPFLGKRKISEARITFTDPKKKSWNKDDHFWHKTKFKTRINTSEDQEKFYKRHWTF